MTSSRNWWRERSHFVAIVDDGSNWMIFEVDIWGILTNSEVFQDFTRFRNSEILLDLKVRSIGHWWLRTKISIFRMNWMKWIIWRCLRILINLEVSEASGIAFLDGFHQFGDFWEFFNRLEDSNDRIPTIRQLTSLTGWNVSLRHRNHRLSVHRFANDSLRVYCARDKRDYATRQGPGNWQLVIIKTWRTARACRNEHEKETLICIVGFTRLPGIKRHKTSSSIIRISTSLLMKIIDSEIITVSVAA